jgi:hypothetical protein
MATALDRFDFVIQPGWRNSGPQHWQSHWQQQLGARRVHNQNWDEPELADWLAGLENALAGCRRPAIVIAHSLGCITLAHAAERHAGRIAGALLVAPADVERANVPAEIAGFGPIPRQRLPFPARMIASTNDLFCHPERARLLGQRWGSPIHWLDHGGHINVESGHGAWPEGLALLANFARTLRSAA